MNRPIDVVRWPDHAMAVLGGGDAGGGRLADGDRHGGRRDRAQPGLRPAQPPAGHLQRAADDPPAVGPHLRPRQRRQALRTGDRQRHRDGRPAAVARPGDDLQRPLSAAGFAAHHRRLRQHLQQQRAPGRRHRRAHGHRRRRDRHGRAGSSHGARGRAGRAVREVPLQLVQHRRRGRVLQAPALRRDDPPDRHPPGARHPPRRRRSGDADHRRAPRFPGRPPPSATPGRTTSTASGT